MAFKLTNSMKNQIIEGIEKHLFAGHKGKFIAFPLTIQTTYGQMSIELKIQIPDMVIYVPTGPIDDKYASHKLVELKSEDILG